jgi:hypothetical protein
MCTVSFDKGGLDIAIHNQCSGLELTSPVYSSTGIPYVSPSQQIDSGTTMKASFRTAFKHGDFNGVLLYKIQRKHASIVDDQHNRSIAFIKGNVKNIHLLVVWNIGWDYCNFYTCLIECTDNFTWDEDRLWALCHQYMSKFHNNCKSNRITWLTHDGKVMKTRLDVIYRSDITI